MTALRQCASRTLSLRTTTAPHPGKGRGAVVVHRLSGGRRGLDQPTNSFASVKRSFRRECRWPYAK